MNKRCDTKDLDRSTVLWLFAVSFLLWFVCFPGFLIKGVTFISDASSYAFMTNYFSWNLSKGVYPQWLMEGAAGVPFEFFCRRLGSFNPIYVVLLFLKNFLPYFQAYSLFLASYFLFGVIGFYRIGRLLLGSRLLAFTAAVFLMYSSWATRLFDSYIHLVFIPLIWSIYFFLVLGRRMSRNNLLALTLCLMILMSTYLPFYFMFILALLAGGCWVFYRQQWAISLRQAWAFFLVNRLLTGCCAVAILVCVVPGVLFLKDNSQAVVMSERAAQVAVQSADISGNKEKPIFLEVGKKTVNSWGIEEDLGFSMAFSDMRYFSFAVVYIPLLGVLFFVLGFFGRTSRLGMMLISLIAFSLLFFSHRFFLHGLFYKYVFFFKYFRNLHFYLWFLIIPLFILLIAEQFGSLLHTVYADRRSRMIAAISVILIHAGYYFFLLMSGHVIAGNVLVILTSGGFFLFLVLNELRLSDVRSFLAWGIVILTFIQAYQVYGYLYKNTGCQYNQSARTFFSYAKNVTLLPTRFEIDKTMVRTDKSLGEVAATSTYYDLAVHSSMIQMMEGKCLNRYELFPFVAYAAVEAQPVKLSDQRMKEIFDQIQGPALVGEILKDDVLYSLTGNKARETEIISRESGLITILGQDVNTLHLKTFFSAPMFLVVQRTYHADWQIRIDGRRTQPRRANLGYLGTWVPAGEHVLTMRFGTDLSYVMNYFILILTYSAVIGFVILSWIDRRRSRQ
ncbi:MAG: hypothetical protein HQL22_04460 [Candidatus Omnitrophica bacterium]|nr:hypothetical protein [Candidatus Omnitrophota bacterium]